MLFGRSPKLVARAAIALVHNGVLSVSPIILALHVVLAKPPQLRCSVLGVVAILTPIIKIAGSVAIKKAGRIHSYLPSL